MPWSRGRRPITAAPPRARTLEGVRANVEFLSERGVQCMVADNACHSSAMLVAMGNSGVRAVIREPECDLVYANRQRVRSEHGHGLSSPRSERVERSFAHMCASGGMQRTHLPGRDNILKRLLIHAAAFDIALLGRKLYRIGSPERFRGLQSN